MNKIVKHSKFSFVMCNMTEQMELERKKSYAFQVANYLSYCSLQVLSVCFQIVARRT